MTDISSDIEQPRPNDGNVPTNDDYAADEQDAHDQQDRGRSRFTQGEMLRFVKVRFPGNSRAFPFLIGNRYFAYGQKVVAMSDRGMAVGYINSFPYEVAFEEHMLPVRSIAKVATEDDLKAERENYSREKEAERICIKYIDRYRLDMTLTHVQFIQFGKKAVFYFNAPTRVDFRDLVKDLVGELRMRIELRQISVRDRTAALGGLGACGLQTCCSSFLTQYGQVSIKMAKNQNLALVPSKINGVCGQLKCCIKYEDDVYSHKRSMLPRENSVVRALNGDRGRVTKLHILEEQFEMITLEGKIRRYTKDMFDPKVPSEKADDFPRQFEHVVNETQTLIAPAAVAAPVTPAAQSESASAGDEAPEALAVASPDAADEMPVAEQETDPDAHGSTDAAPAQVPQRSSQHQGQHQGQQRDRHPRGDHGRHQQRQRDGQREGQRDGQRDGQRHQQGRPQQQREQERPARADNAAPAGQEQQPHQRSDQEQGPNNKRHHHGRRQHHKPNKGNQGGGGSRRR